jgi:hypothetical protein
VSHPPGRATPVFDQYISVIADRILSIRLSDDDETSGLTEDFFRRRTPLRLFSNLRSLTFTHISSYSLFQEIIDECRTVPHLTHIRFEQLLLNLSVDEYRLLMDSIGDLPR